MDRKFGLLDAFKQYVRDAMPGGLLNPEGAQVAPAVRKGAEEVRQGLLAYGAANKAALENPTWDNVKAAVDGNMTAAGMAPLAMTVWHGSPHKFTKFDMSKIGTGEGAQAYGHGLYMAETPDVAQTYKQSADWRQKTMDQMRYLVDGKEVSPKGVDDGLLYHYRMSAPDLFAERIQHLEKQKAGSIDQARYYAEQAKLGDDPERYARMAKRAQETAKKFDEELQLAAKLQNQKVEAATGHLYKVDIPDEAVARFLDWDKPLSQQAPEVQKALQGLGVGSPKQAEAMSVDELFGALGGYENTLGRGEATGQKVYKELSDALSKDAREMVRNGQYINDTNAYGYDNAAKRLRELGIPGIRYLDGGSRSAGQGSSNFVLFSDQLPRILEINGQATGLQPWAKGEWRGLLD